MGVKNGVSGSAAGSPVGSAPGWITPQSAYTVGITTVPSPSAPYTPASRCSPGVRRHSQGMAQVPFSQAVTSRRTFPARNTAIFSSAAHASPENENVTAAPTMPAVSVAGRVTAASAPLTAM